MERMADTLETTEVRMRDYTEEGSHRNWRFLSQDRNVKAVPSNASSVLSLTKTPRLQLLKMKRAEVK